MSSEVTAVNGVGANVVSGEIATVGTTGTAVVEVVGVVVGLPVVDVLGWLVVVVVAATKLVGGGDVRTLEEVGEPTVDETDETVVVGTVEVVTAFVVVVVACVVVDDGRVVVVMHRSTRSLAFVSHGLRLGPPAVANSSKVATGMMAHFILREPLLCLNSLAMCGKEDR